MNRRLVSSHTFIGTLILGMMMVVGLLLICNMDPAFAPVAGVVYASFVGGLVGLNAVLGGNRMVAHLAAGTGVKGAASTLMTNARPGQEGTTETVTSTDVRESTVTTSQQ
jgi:hypothetical protein